MEKNFREKNIMEKNFGKLILWKKIMEIFFQETDFMAKILYPYKRLHENTYTKGIKTNFFTTFLE